MRTKRKTQKDRITIRRMASNFSSLISWGKPYIVFLTKKSRIRGLTHMMMTNRGKIMFIDRHMPRRELLVYLNESVCILASLNPGKVRKAPRNVPTMASMIFSVVRLAGP